MASYKINVNGCTFQRKHDILKNYYVRPGNKFTRKLIKIEFEDSFVWSQFRGIGGTSAMCSPSFMFSLNL